MTFVASPSRQLLFRRLARNTRGAGRYSLEQRKKLAHALQAAIEFRHRCSV